MTDALDTSALGRLDLFFSEGANTDAVSNFFSEHEESLMRFLDEYNGETDSDSAIGAYAIYKAYGQLMEEMIHRFLSSERHSVDGVPDEETLANAVMEAWKDNSLAYTCTAYVAAALDFDAFCSLAADTMEIMYYPFEGSEGSEESGGVAAPPA